MVRTQCWQCDDDSLINNRNQHEAGSMQLNLVQAVFLFGLFCDPADGGNTFLRNTGGLSTDYMVLYSTRYDSL
jgi:hypothetical protein